MQLRFYVISSICRSWRGKIIFCDLRWNIVENLNPPRRKLTMNEEATTVQAKQPPSGLPAERHRAWQRRFQQGPCEPISQLRARARERDWLTMQLVSHKALGLLLFNTVLLRNAKILHFLSRNVKIRHFLSRKTGFHDVGKKNGKFALRAACTFYAALLTRTHI